MACICSWVVIYSVPGGSFCHLQAPSERGKHCLYDSADQAETMAEKRPFDIQRYPDLLEVEWSEVEKWRRGGDEFVNGYVFLLHLI